MFLSVCFCVCDVFPQSADIASYLSLQQCLTHPLALHLRRFMDLNVHHKEQSLMCDYTIVPLSQSPHFDMYDSAICE